MSLKAVVAAWQAGCESLLTGRLVPQLVDAEENRTSCQPSGRHPTFRSARRRTVAEDPHLKFNSRGVDSCGRLGFGVGLFVR